ncbi:MAG: hypothetical protein B1H03_07545 [Planctomycetales bacterium 4484_113]|nr:MAG: hypothetical protein B1H03_07545 [Planctomycetales bacterium 4484_113]
MERLEHCEIEMLEKKQLDFYWELKNDPEIARLFWGNMLRVFPKRELEKEIEKRLEDKGVRKLYPYIVKDKAGRRLAYVEIKRQFWEEPGLSAQLTVVPRRPSYLRRKAVSEGVDFALGKCFSYLHLHTVWAAPLEYNTDYIDFLKGKGFQQQGIARGCTQMDGVFYGRAVMDLIDREWMASRPRPSLDHGRPRP